MELVSVVRSSVVRPTPAAVAAARSLEVAGQLRAAIMEGDDTRIARLLSDLLRVRGLTKGQRVRLQSRALLNLVHSLRSVALNDELTGLLNRRGFMQTATRLLDLALRDRQGAHLVYFRLAIGAAAAAHCARTPHRRERLPQRRSPAENRRGGRPVDHATPDRATASRSA